MSIDGLPSPVELNEMANQYWARKRAEEIHTAEVAWLAAIKKIPDAAAEGQTAVCVYERITGISDALRGVVAERRGELEQRGFTVSDDGNRVTIGWQQPWQPTDDP